MIFKRKYLSWFLRFCIGLSLLILCSCDNSSSNGDSTGSVSFNLDWKSAASSGSDMSLTATGDVCTDYQISTIRAIIYNAANANIATESFNCSAHSGSLNAVPIGTGYRLVVQAIDAGNAVIIRGVKGNVDVKADIPYNAGKIKMDFPEVSQVSPDASITAALLDTVITATFDEAMSEPTITTATFTLEKTGDSSSVAGQVTYDSTSMTATFTPDADLEPGTKYLVTLTTNMQDIAANPLAGGNNTDGSYTWTFITETVTCTYALASASQTFSHAGGFGVITISTSYTTCSWTAEKTDDWITFDTTASGTGDGTVDFTVAANNTGTPRSGNITIAGETFVVKQNTPTSLPAMKWDTSKWDEVVWQ